MAFAQFNLDFDFGLLAFEYLLLLASFSASPSNILLMELPPFFAVSVKDFSLAAICFVAGVVP